MDNALRQGSEKVKKLNLGYWKMHGTQISYLLHADDIVIMAENEEDLQYNVNVLNGTLSNINVNRNVRKTKSIITASGNNTINIECKGHTIK